MNEKDIMNRLDDRIMSCHASLINARQSRMHGLYIEGMRCRLDELILLYHIIKNITFIEACKELNIRYEDVNVLEGEA